MKKVKITLLIISFFMLSCATNQYINDYEPIKVFLIQEGMDASKGNILQIEKVDNQKVLADFNEFKSNGPYFDSNFKPIPFYDDREYKKMREKYLNDTLKRYWKKEDFLGFNFILKKRKDIISDSKNQDFPSQYCVYISEPMYYSKQKYLMFSYDIYNYNGGVTKLVFMKREKGKWKIDRISSTDVFF